MINLRSRPARFVAAAVVALLLVACTGPGGSRGPGDNRPPNRPEVSAGAQKGCDVRPKKPVQITYPIGVRIKGEAVAVCDLVPPEHVMEVSIEEELPGGVWSEVENEMHNLTTVCTAVPAPGIPVPCEHVIPCFTGHYRTLVTVYGVDQFGPFTYTPPERPDEFIECPA